MAVASEIGGMTVEEMLDRMSGWELQLWMAELDLRAEDQKRGALASDVQRRMAARVGG